MLGFRNIPTHTRLALLHANWVSFDLCTSKAHNSHVLSFLHIIVRILWECNVYFVVAGGYVSWLVGNKRRFNDVDIFVNIDNYTNVETLIGFLKHIGEYRVSSCRYMFVGRQRVERYILNIHDNVSECTFQIIFVIGAYASFTEYTHAILTFFPLTHIRLAMSYFTYDFTQCKLYRLDRPGGHYRQSLVLYKQLVRYVNRYEHLILDRTRRNSTCFASRLKHFGSISRTLQWVRKHVLYTKRVHKARRTRQRQIKHVTTNNLSLKSMCIQALERYYLDNYGQNILCLASRIVPL